MSATVVAPAPVEKFFLRLGVAGLAPEAVELLRECFRALGVRLAIGVVDAKRAERGGYDCIAVRLNDEARPILQALRQSANGRRTLVYGISGDPESAFGFADFGINAVLPEPLRPSFVTKIIEPTYLLAVAEFRRFIRLPLVTAVDIRVGESSFRSLSREISAGGMCLYLAEDAPPQKKWELTFTLPRAKPMAVCGVTCWRLSQERLTGVFFDPNDGRRKAVRDWIDDFLNAA